MLALKVQAESCKLVSQRAPSQMLQRSSVLSIKQHLVKAVFLLKCIFSYLMIAKCFRNVVLYFWPVKLCKSKLVPLKFLSVPICLSNPDYVTLIYGYHLPRIKHPTSQEGKKWTSDKTDLQLQMYFLRKSRKVKVHQNQKPLNFGATRIPLVHSRKYPLLHHQKELFRTPTTKNLLKTINLPFLSGAKTNI